MAVDISVVIPTFGRPKELVEAIDSVLSQADVTVHVHVIDDNPDGSAREIIQKYDDSRVEYHRQDPPSRGVVSAVRNNGWRQATGNVVHFLDDDDRIPPGTYRTYLDAFSRNPDRGVAFGLIEPFGEQSALDRERAFFLEAARRARLCERRGRWWIAAQQLFGNTMVVNSACVIRRECIDALGGFDSNLKLVEDVDFWGRAMLRFGCIFIDRVLLDYRISSTSLMHRPQSNDNLFSSYRRMHRRYIEDFGVIEYVAFKGLARTLGRWL